MQPSTIVNVSYKQGIMCNRTYLEGLRLKFQFVFLAVITKILHGLFKFLPMFMVIVYVSFATETQSTHLRIQGSRQHHTKLDVRKTVCEDEK